jgi:hypothetical protein
MKPALLALSFFALAASARADEIRLKDGSKIVGNVVGFEDGSFKIETAYGFAMVRKDSIAEILPTAETKPAASKGSAGKSSEDAPPSAKPATASSTNPVPAAKAEAKSQTVGGKLVESAEPKSQPVPVKPVALAGAKTQLAPAATAPSQTSEQSPAKQPEQAAPTAAPAAPDTSPAAAAAPPTPPPAPAAPPEPPPVREMVRGNLYINQTYGFQMYRAPDWQPIVAARAALPNAVAALGTSDQSTLLIIGRDRAQGPLDAQSSATELTVQEIYENYRPMPSQRITIAGVPAIERQFRGVAEGRDWAVTLVTLERNSDVFTILAMTDANSELVQFEANVIAKAIASLQFDAAPASAPKLPN